MCTTKPVTEASISNPDQVIGRQCPLCEARSAVGYMQFLDPHGVIRVDPQVLECEARRHSFTLSGGALRLLAADSVRPRQPQFFEIAASGDLALRG